MHVLVSQSGVLYVRSSDIDASNTEPPQEDSVNEQLDGSQIVYEECGTPLTMSSCRNQIHLRK